MGSLAPQHDSSGKLLPAILCLHGGGSNSTVFKIQTRRLQWALNSQFRFVFAQAPHEGTPGMGMLPVFASCAPFYRWVTRRYTAPAGTGTGTGTGTSSGSGAAGGAGSSPTAVEFTPPDEVAQLD